MRSKVGGYIAIAVGIAISIGFFASMGSTSEDKVESVFHVTLANSELYESGIYRESFEVEEGLYKFRFVPNGDSPQTLTISLSGETFDFLENFKLEGTPHETGISTYYTWDYLGTKQIAIDNQQELEITIDPNGNVVGPVSVEIIYD